MLLFLTFHGQGIRAQNQSWSMVPYILNFTGGTVNASIHPALNNTYQSQFPSASVNDPFGDLLFSVSDGTVYNRSGTNSFGINNPDYSTALPPAAQQVNGATEVLIVPVPGDCKSFYIISSEVSGNTTGPNPLPYYIKVFVDGDFIEGRDANNQPTTDATSLAGTVNNGYYNYALHTGTIHMGVTPLRTATNDRFLFIQNAQQLYRYKITASGIAYDQYTYDLAVNGGINTNGSSQLRSEMEIVQLANGTYRLALPIQTTVSAAHFITVVYNLNAGGVITSQQINYTIGTAANLDRMRGLEFDATGSHLYVTKENAPHLICINLSNGTTTNFTVSPDFRHSQIELAANGHLYAVAEDRMGCLQNAANPVTAVWVDPAPNLGANVLGLPGFPLAYANLGVLPERALRYVPDQIDGEDFMQSSALTFEKCCVDYSDFEQETDYTAPTGIYTWTTGSNPWNVTTPIRVEDKLTIPTGAHVTLQDMTLQFGYNGSITIEKGASLTLKGSKLTNLPPCNYMWQGIAVQGTPGSADLVQNGVLSLTTGAGFQPSIIENAITAAALPNGGQLLSYYGIFRNNWQGVTMGTNNLFSGQLQNVLNSTTFESNAPLIAPHAGKKPEVFLDLNGIQNIDFVNENHFTKGSYGIKAVDCRFNLSDATFTEVDFGIESKVMSPTVTTGHEFHNNRFYKYFTAIRIDNGLNDKIGTNLFNPATHNGTQEQNYIGISLQACNGFLLTDNIFYKNKYGIMVHKSGLLNNRISTNTGTGNQFISCWRGIHTTGTNPSLQIKCNYFQNNQASTQYSAAWYVHDLLCNQGSNNQSDPQSPAGNRFYHAPASRVDLVSKQGSGPNGLNFIYYHHSPNGHPEVKPTVNNANWIQLVNKNIAYDQLTACTGITLMVLADNSPDTAKLIIDNTTDSILARQYANELVQWYIIHNMDSAAIDYLNTNNLGLDERLLFSLYAEHGAYTETTDLLAQMSLLTDEESVNYVALNTILVEWSAMGTSPFDMTAAEEAIIRNVALSNSSSAIAAQNILHLVFDEPYQQIESDTASGRMLFEEAVADDAVQLEAAIPNPAHDYTTVAYALPQGAADIWLIMTDVMGREVLKQALQQHNGSITLALTALKPGTYFYHLHTNTGVSHSQRLTVLR